MFTVEKLLGMAADAEARINSWPNGTPSVDGVKLGDLYRVKEEALAAALWMEKKGHKELEYVGPFGTPFLPKRGEKVRIKGGSQLFSTHPKYSRANGGKAVTGSGPKRTMWRLCEPSRTP